MTETLKPRYILGTVSPVGVSRHPMPQPQPLLPADIHRISASIEVSDYTTEGVNDAVTRRYWPCVQELVAKGANSVTLAGFPIASNGDFEAVSAIAKQTKNAVVCGLSRAGFKDIDRAGEALKLAPRRRIHTFISTSPVHMKHKLQMEPSAVLEAVSASVGRARNWTDDVQWSAEDATRALRIERGVQRNSRRDLGAQPARQNRCAKDEAGGHERDLGRPERVRAVVQREPRGEEQEGGDEEGGVAEEAEEQDGEAEEEIAHFIRESFDQFRNESFASKYNMFTDLYDIVNSDGKIEEAETAVLNQIRELIGTTETESN